MCCFIATHTYLYSIPPSHAICIWYFYTLVHTNTSVYSILINSYNHTSVYSICHPMPYVSGISTFIHTYICIDHSAIPCHILVVCFTLIHTYCTSIYSILPSHATYYWVFYTFIHTYLCIQHSAIPCHILLGILYINIHIPLYTAFCHPMPHITGYFIH